MDKVFVVYTTDNHHSYASRYIIGVGNDITSAIALVLQQAEKDGEELDEDQLYNITHISQTQGYSGDGEFQIEEFEINTLI